MLFKNSISLFTRIVGLAERVGEKGVLIGVFLLSFPVVGLLTWLDITNSFRPDLGIVVLVLNLD